LVGCCPERDFFRFVFFQEMISLWVRDFAIVWLEASVLGSLLIRQPSKKTSVSGSSSGHHPVKLPGDQQQQEKTSTLERLHLELTSTKSEEGGEKTELP